MSHLHKVMLRKVMGKKKKQLFFPEGDFHVVLLLGEETK